MLNSHEVHDVVIVGAGPAGLATSRELGRAGVGHVVLERGSEIGDTWARLYDGLVLHTGKHFSALPGMPFPVSTPLFPSRRDFLDYLHRYAETYRVPVETGMDVTGLDRTADGWTVRTAGAVHARARIVVFATGIVSNPYVPAIASRECFRGRVLHSVEYCSPGAFAGQRTLIVGGGNSAAEIALELAAAGVDVTVSTRSRARVFPRHLFGVPSQYVAVAANLVASGFSRTFGRPSETPRCPRVRQIGLQFSRAVRARTIRRKGGIQEFTTGGIGFSDGSEEPFDQVILATGYRAAVGMLEGLIRLDACGFARRRDRVVCLDQPGLYFVGHNYDTQGGLRNIAQDAPRAAKLIAIALADPSWRPA